MKQGDSVLIPRLTAQSIAMHLRETLGECQWTEALDPKPKVTDLSAIEFLTTQLQAWSRNRNPSSAEIAHFSVGMIATWLSAANTNSMAAALILGEQS